MPSYRAETKTHINEVRKEMNKVTMDLGRRLVEHDRSKLEDPEQSGFEKHKLALSGLVYGSPEYLDSVAMLGDTLTHHYKNNDHHPEYFNCKQCRDCGERYYEKDGYGDVAVCRCGYILNAYYHPDVSAMNLMQITEMLCDWKAATKRHADGNIHKSIDFNQNRFGYTDELKRILHNTATWLEERDSLG